MKHRYICRTLAEFCVNCEKLEWYHSGLMRSSCIVLGWSLWLSKIFTTFLKILYSRGTNVKPRVHGCHLDFDNFLFILYIVIPSDCWTTWTQWTDCAGECGFRFTPRTRNRTCLTPLTPFGTECCPGDDYQEITCDPQWGSTDCTIGKNVRSNFRSTDFHSDLFCRKPYLHTS